jgi:alpha-D-xyloside xylohydrolase
MNRAMFLESNREATMRRSILCQRSRPVHAVPAVMLFFLATLSAFKTAAAQTPYPPYIMNEAVDISPDFQDFANGYFLADSLASFDPETGRGTLKYVRHQYVTRLAFNNMLASLTPAAENIFPGNEYPAAPELHFAVELVSPRTVRIVAHSKPQVVEGEPSLMLVGGTAAQDRSGWQYSPVDGGHRYTSDHGSVTITEYPWHVELRDADGRLLTRTLHQADHAPSYTPVLPFSFVRKASDYSQEMAAVFELSPGEKIYGGGESFTQLDKRGQKLFLFLDDANGAENVGMYKPIPFFMSSRGYGMFVHSTAPMVFDFGRDFTGASTLMVGDDALDLFVFLGEPKAILDEYTDLTGKAPMPPLWSFGLWMSRITYFSEEDVRNVADSLRHYEVPADVIHIDTGWFETDWRSDYQFSRSRFDDPAAMMEDLRAMGFHVSLWQLPYFVPENRLYPEIVEQGLAVTDAKGNLPYPDAILDFSNPVAVDWYQEKLARLLELGVGAIKVDFGEAAPLNGLYDSGRTGWFEHNLYPLRYNRAVMDVTERVTGERIIWARSAWAGSQRYPVHWGGDPATADIGMAATLRGGLSFGLSGFTFWSHDIGGFTATAPEPLHSRWVPFGFLTSHTRSHGQPPTEPWLFSDAFLEGYRRADEMRYRLMPYIWAQAMHSTENGLPMVRALFVEYPEDPGAWLVEDQYLFGSDILVAPLMEEVSSRDVYLPGGRWIDYQTGQVHEPGWRHIEAGTIPAVILVRDGATIPHIELAQSTADLDWSRLELVVFASDGRPATGRVALPDSDLHQVALTVQDGAYRIDADPLEGRVRWTVRSMAGPGQ